MKNTRLALALCATLGGGAFSLAYAEDTYKLDSSVISASGFAQDLREAPATINVISAEELAEKPFTDLAEAIAEIPGVDLHASRGKTGAFNITMRGLTGYTLVLIDGRRQSVGADVFPNGFGEVSNALLPPLSAIERIEVIKGPMSTLYGSEALGGVINIITKKVSDTWQHSVGFDTIINENSEWGNTNTLSLYSRGPVLHDVLGVDLRARFSNRQQSHVEFTNGAGVRVPGDQAQSPTQANFYNFGTKITYKLNENNTFKWDLDYTRNVYNNRNCELGTLTHPLGLNSTSVCNAGVVILDPNGTAAGVTGTPTGAGLTGGYFPTMTVNRFVGSAQHELEISNWKVTSGFQYNVLTNDSRTVVGQISHPRLGQNRNIKAQDVVLDTKAVGAIGDRNTLSVGADYRFETIKDNIASPTYFDSWILGLYAEDEFSMLDNLFLTLGARYNHHQNFGSNVSPRAYVVYNPTQLISIKGGVSTGFRAPNPNRLISGAFNYNGQGRFPIFGNPNLKEETSVNYELAFIYDDNSFFNSSITAFYTVFDDKISTQTYRGTAGGNASIPGIGDCGASQCSQAINLGKVEYKGIELGAGIKPIGNLNLNLSYTYLDSNIKEDSNPVNVGQAEANSLKHNIVAKASYGFGSVTPWIKSEAQLKRFRGATATPVDGDLYYKDIVLFSAGVNYAVNDRWTVNLAVLNLFDKDFTSDWGVTGVNNQGVTQFQNKYNRIEEGRRYYLSVNGTF